LGVVIVSDAYGFYFGQPWWLLASMLVVPVVWLARRNLASLGRVRYAMALLLRVIVILLLVILLARPMLVRKNRRATVIAVMDRSRSIPQASADSALDYLARAAALTGAENQFAIVDVAETASISMLPATEPTLRRRNTTLSGQQSRLASGIEMAMAIAPPDTATRIVLVSEGNETEGDLKEAARTAAANKIPIDVLPLRYRYESEVLFRRLAAPSRARSGQTIDLRFLLDSTAAVRGKLLLTLNDRPLDLMPESDEVAVPVDLVAGTNVKTVSVPVGARGIHTFEAVFMPDDARADRIIENNRASAVTYVAGPGYVRIFDTESAGADIARVLNEADLDASCVDVGLMPTELTRLLDADAVVLVNTPIHHFTMAQQEMLCRYVNDLGGGLVMVGGPESFGAGK
jgi:Ca-activated chloride channel homolog